MHASVEKGKNNAALRRIEPARYEGRKRWADTLSRIANKIMQERCSNVVQLEKTKKPKKY